MFVSSTCDEVMNKKIYMYMVRIRKVWMKGEVAVLADSIRTVLQHILGNLKRAFLSILHLSSDMRHYRG